MAQARATSIEEKNALAHSVHPLYRFQELQAFSPWQRAYILRQCTRKADRQWLVVLACVVWLACSVSAWLFIVPAYSRSAATGFGIVFALGLPFLYIRRAHVRHQLQELLRELRSSDHANHGQQR